MNHTLVAHSDHGTVIGPDHAALVVGPDGDLQLLLPDKERDDMPMPIMMVFLAAVAIRSDDPEWVKETLAILDE